MANSSVKHGDENRPESGGASPLAAPVHPSFGEALRFWLKLGFISFGGPTGQIAIMHTELVERRRWIGERRFFHALNFCMLLPGPEATQLAIYCGWLLHRTWGGLVAGILFVMPSALILWGLSWAYVTYGRFGAGAAIFHGLKAAVLAIVVVAVWRIGKKVLKNTVMWALAVLAFVAIFCFAVPFPAIVAGAAVIGWIGGWRWEKIFNVVRGGATQAGAGAERAVIGDDDPTPNHSLPSGSRSARILVIGIALWWLPVWAAGAWLGWDGVLARQGIFFSQAAMVTFGGAYAVLPYVAQQAVEHYGWLNATQMLDGLGLAETTPGPLIMVLQFVGFMGGWHHAGGVAWLTMATLGAAMTTWVTFVPCFLWIFLGAPYIERLRDHARLTCALSAVTAAVVGVVLNLAVWFGWHAILPETGGIDGFVAVVALAAFAALHWGKQGVVRVVLASGLIGLAWSGVGGV